MEAHYPIHVDIHANGLNDSIYIFYHKFDSGEVRMFRIITTMYGQWIVLWNWLNGYRAWFECKFPQAKKIIEKKYVDLFGCPRIVACWNSWDISGIHGNIVLYVEVKRSFKPINLINNLDDSLKTTGHQISISFLLVLGLKTMECTCLVSVSQYYRKFTFFSENKISKNSVHTVHCRDVIEVSTLHSPLSKPFVQLWTYISSLFFSFSPLHYVLIRPCHTYTHIQNR